MAMRRLGARRVAVLGLALLLAIGLWQGGRVAWMFLRPPVYESVPPALPARLPAPAFLVFSKTNGYVHEEAIPAGIAALAEIARERGWSSFATANGAVMNDADLARFAAVVWNNTSGDTLTDAQEAAFRRYVEGGGGFVGIHGAGGDPSYEWAWYPEMLVGARFTGHTLSPHFPRATLHVEDPGHPATRGLPAAWSREEEWYTFAASPRARGVRVLLRLDESSYRARGFGDAPMGDHPIAWCHCVGRGRALYSALGHRASAFAEPEHRAFLAGALAWAAGLEGSCDSPIAPP
jgi:hypothetical protein